MKTRYVLFAAIVFGYSCHRTPILSERRIVNKFLQEENNVKYIYDQGNRLIGTSGIFLGHKYEVKIGYLNNNHVREIKGYINNDPFGHLFKFYPDGTLREYNFLLFQKKSSYTLNFYENGTVSTSYGTPLVLHYLDTEKQFSSAIFSTAIFDSLYVRYSFDKINYKKLNCNRLEGYPMLYQGKLPLSKQRIYYEIEAYISESRVVFIDSVNVDY